MILFFVLNNGDKNVGKSGKKNTNLIRDVYIEVLKSSALDSKIFIIIFTRDPKEFNMQRMKNEENNCWETIKYNPYLVS